MNCWVCHGDLLGEERYHASCSKSLFGSAIPPKIDFGLNQITDLAKKVLRSQASISGVQQKLSAHIQKVLEGQERMTLVGLWGDYILKTPSSEFPDLPEVEHTTMAVGKALGLDTVTHGLVEMADGKKAYPNSSYGSKRWKDHPSSRGWRSTAGSAHRIQIQSFS